MNRRDGRRPDKFKFWLKLKIDLKRFNKSFLHDVSLRKSVGRAGILGVERRQATGPRGEEDMKRKPRTSRSKEDAGVFDREHLRRYTMNSAELEREVLGLFLDQAPAIVAQMRSASSAAEWKLATHTLKGSAAAIGATEVNRLAARLERLTPASRGVGAEIDRIDAAVARFRAAIGEILG